MNNQKKIDPFHKFQQRIPNWQFILSKELLVNQSVSGHAKIEKVELKYAKVILDIFSCIL